MLCTIESVNMCLCVGGTNHRHGDTGPLAKLLEVVSQQFAKPGPARGLCPLLVIPAVGHGDRRARQGHSRYFTPETRHNVALKKLSRRKTALSSQHGAQPPAARVCKHNIELEKIHKSINKVPRTNPQTDGPPDSAVPKHPPNTNKGLLRPHHHIRTPKHHNPAPSSSLTKSDTVLHVSKKTHLDLDVL